MSTRRKRERCLWPTEGGRWRCRVRYRVAGGVKELQATCDTKAEAQTRLAELRLQAHAARSGSFTVCTTRISTFGEALDYYLARREPRGSRSYFDRLKRDLGEVSIPELPERLERYLRALGGSVTNKGKPITNGGLNRYLAWAKAAVGLCIKHGLIDGNPLARLSKLPETPRDVSLSDGDRLRLLNDVAEHAPDLLPVVTFATLVPTRRGELQRMRREDVDVLNGVIRVRSGTTKNRDGRYLPVPEELEEYFRSIPADCPWAFYRRGPDGSYRAIGGFRKAWLGCLRRVGLQGLRFHDLRAYSATNLVLAGNDERSVMQVAGWRSPMLRVYFRRDSLTTARTLKMPESGGRCGGGVGASTPKLAENC